MDGGRTESFKTYEVWDGITGTWVEVESLREVLTELPETSYRISEVTQVTYGPKANN